MNKQKNSHLLCPCGTLKTYQDCCAPFHLKELPDNALQLMRSRYSAYALGLPAYIILTTHPENPAFCKDVAVIAAAYAETEFKQLDILDFQEKGDAATVTFTAHLVQRGKDISFTEKSDFTKVHGKWLYRKGEIYRS